MKRYRAILFDVDETLFDFKRAERAALAAAFADRGIACGLSEMETYEAINKDIWKRLERGEIDQETLKIERFRLLFESLGLTGAVRTPGSAVQAPGASSGAASPEPGRAFGTPGGAADAIDPATFSAFYLARLGEGSFLLPGAEDICRYLSGKYRLAIVTNGLKEVQRPRIAASPIAGLFDAVSISEEAGGGKPGPAIFDRAFTLLGLSAEDKGAALMIGDSLSSDIQGGVNYGIDTCWYNPSKAPNPTGPRPTYEIGDLAELRDIL